MPEIAVAVVAQDDEQRTVLQMQVDSTTVARTVHSFNAFPVGATDAVLRRLHDLRPDVVVLDIPPASVTPALRAIELLHQELPKAGIFAIGEMSQPQTIVSAMRMGAHEFLERPTNTSALLEAFVRLTAAQRKARGSEQRGKVITVINAKGGNGATTVAVNCALALQSSQGNVAVVDLAPLGHVALHLNIKPPFTIADALQNLHRLDSSLLDSFMARHEGLNVLASAPTPISDNGGELARLFDVLVGHYSFVIVDASSRLDACTRVVADVSDLVLLVAQTDVASLWSAARVRQFLGESEGTERVRLVLNRFHKIAGFSEADAETAAGTRLLWKLPNNYAAISSGIDRGVPVMQQNHSEIARSFSGLAQALSEKDSRRKNWSLFKTA